MTAFDEVHDRLIDAANKFVDAGLATREMKKKLGPDPIASAIAEGARSISFTGEHPYSVALSPFWDREQKALEKLVAAYNYCEKVSNSDYSGEPSLDFLKREARAAAAASTGTDDPT